MKKPKNKLSYFIVILLSFLIYFLGTDGFSAFTAETARVNELIEEQPKLPDVTLEDHMERTYSFEELEDKYLFITFFYSSCTTVCVELEANMAEVYEEIPEQYLGEDIVFLSISFDPERDDPEKLKLYHQYYGVDDSNWRMARVNDQSELKTLIDEFGVIVIPDGQGNFAHNSAFYLVNREGYLIDVMDYQKIDEAIKQVKQVLNEEKGV